MNRLSAVRLPWKNGVVLGNLISSPPGVRRGAVVCPGGLREKERNFDSREMKFLKTLEEVLRGNTELNGRGSSQFI